MCLGDMQLGVNVRMDSKKKSYVQKRLDYMSKHANHSRLNRQHHNQGEACDHILSSRIFNSIMKKINSYELRNYEANRYGHGMDLLIISHQLRHVSYPTRNGGREKSEHTSTLVPNKIDHL